MTRTIHFCICGDINLGPIPCETRRRIHAIKQQVNEQFTWTSGQLSLHFFTTCATKHGIPTILLGAALLGVGRAEVADDDWNAALAIRFVSWASTQLPDGAFIRTYDEGGYVVPDRVNVLAGSLKVSKPLGRPRATDLEGTCRNVPAARYVDRPEVEGALELHGDVDLGTLTLENVADRIVFPWHETERQAAA